jgi:hypothetical protein
MRFLLAIALPVVFFALVIPLVLGIVPPNDLYGFRTAKTMSSRETWYPANRIAGWCMAGSAAAQLVFIWPC